MMPVEPLLTINTSVKDNANMVADISVTTRQQRSASHELAKFILKALPIALRKIWHRRELLHG